MDTAAKPITLADSGVTRYSIVLPPDVIPSETYAATELQRFLGEVTGAEFGITSAGSSLHTILLGVGPHCAPFLHDVDTSSLGGEEFVIRTVGDCLVIAGGRPRGTLHGVYCFLEHTVGCRWFTQDVSHIPKYDTLSIDPIDIRVQPSLEYREVFYWEAFDGDWAARHRLNSSRASLEARHGGKVRYGKQSFVHTFDTLVPVEKYFAQHPEYFSEVDGERTSERTQLCLTNPDVLALSIEGVARWIREDPDASIFSVSQNDWRNPCQCAECSAIDTEEGSHAGTLLRFVNSVAEAIEDEAPHVAIDTLAYLYTRQPPKHVRPRPNVIVRLCSIECCFAHPMESCPENATFVEDIEGWGKICDRLYMWDYVTSFKHYIMPWPNLRVLGANVRFLRRHNVVGLFEQGNYTEGGGGEASELRAYMLAKLLTDPEYDERVAMDEFIDAVYGAAAPRVRDYVNLIHSITDDPECHIYTTVARIHPEVITPYLTDELVARADAILTEAEKIAESETVRHRVEKAHMPVQYLLIRKMPDGPERDELLAKWIGVAEREGIIFASEGRRLDHWVEHGAREMHKPVEVKDSDAE
jgi:hypothetical protein